MVYKGIARLLDTVFKQKCRTHQASASTECEVHAECSKHGDCSRKNHNDGPVKCAGLREPNHARGSSEGVVVKVSAAYHVFREKDSTGINLLLCLRCPYIPLQLAEPHIKASLQKRAPHLHIAIVVDISFGRDRVVSQTELELAKAAVDHLVVQLTGIAALYVISCAPTSERCAKAAKTVIVDSSGCCEEKTNRCARAAKSCLMEGAANTGGHVEKHVIFMSNNIPLIVPSDSHQWAAIMRKNKRCGIHTDVIGVGRSACISSIRKLMLTQLGTQRRQGYTDQMNSGEAIPWVVTHMLFHILRVSRSQLGCDLYLRLGAIRHATITHVYGGTVTPEGIGTIEMSDVNYASRRWVMVELEPTQYFKEGRDFKGIWNLDLVQNNVSIFCANLFEAVPIEFDLDPSHWKALATRHANLSPEDEVSQHMSQQESGSEKDAELPYASCSSSEELSSSSSASFESVRKAKVSEERELCEHPEQAFQEKSKLSTSFTTTASRSLQNRSMSHSHSLSL